MPKMASLFRKSLPFLLFTAISVGSFNCMKVDPAQKEQKQQEPLPEAKELAGLPPVEQLDTLVKMNSKDYVALMKQEIRKYKGEVKIGMDVQWLKPDGDFMIDFDFTGNTEKGWNYDCKFNRWCRPGYSPNDKIKQAEFKKDDCTIKYTKESLEPQKIWLDGVLFDEEKHEGEKFDQALYLVNQKIITAKEDFKEKAPAFYHLIFNTKVVVSSERHFYTNEQMDVARKHLDAQ